MIYVETLMITAINCTEICAAEKVGNLLSLASKLRALAKILF
jgi:hypothetical protein